MVCAQGAASGRRSGKPLAFLDRSAGRVSPLARLCPGWGAQGSRTAQGPVAEAVRCPRGIARKALPLASQDMWFPGSGCPPPASARAARSTSVPLAPRPAAPGRSQSLFEEMEILKINPHSLPRPGRLADLANEASAPHRTGPHRFPSTPGSRCAAATAAPQPKNPKTMCGVGRVAASGAVRLQDKQTQGPRVPVSAVSCANH